jgi:alpha-tubulin suppressor-like RCC1 family protein
MRSIVSFLKKVLSTTFPSRALAQAALLGTTLMLITVLVLDACGEGTTEPPPPLPPTVMSVEVSPATATLTSLGETVQLTATARDASGNAISGKTFTWSSSDEDCASVSSAGLVTAAAFGTATISATADGVSGSCSLTVAEVFLAVTGGFAHTCGLTSAGDAYCWGGNGVGQLGDGTTTDWHTPVPVSGGLGFAAVSAGVYHTCALTTDGSAYCWGNNMHGQLGIGSSDLDPHMSPEAVSGGLAFATVSAGESHTCAVTTDGDAYCWGDAGAGKLGDGTTTDRHTPVPVSGGLSFATVSAGYYHTCALATDGSAYCWGWNRDGHLGDGTTTNRHTPVPVSGGSSFATVSAGAWATCAVTSDGSADAYCWGGNGVGQLGDGTTIDRHTPVPVSGGLSFAAVSGGEFHTCAVTTDGSAYCWGFNGQGQLGDGTITDHRSAPVVVSGGLSFNSVSAMSMHTCAVTTDGSAYCWGFNGEGQLGDGTTTDRETPVRVEW